MVGCAEKKSSFLQPPSTRCLLQIVQLHHLLVLYYLKCLYIYKLSVLNRVMVDRMPLFRGLKVDCYVMNAHNKAVMASNF